MHLRFCIPIALAAAVVATPRRPTMRWSRRSPSSSQSRKKARETTTPAGVENARQQGRRGFDAGIEAFDDANPIAANWLRTAVDAIAEAEIAASRKLPADKLEAFATNTKNAPTARRAAYELLAAQDPEAKTRLLPGFLSDKSPELRRDAIANQLEIFERLARPSIKDDLEKLFANARQGSGRTAREEARSQRRQGERHRTLWLCEPREHRRPVQRAREQGLRDRLSARHRERHERQVQGQSRRGGRLEAHFHDRQVRRHRPEQAARQAQERGRVLRSR